MIFRITPRTSWTRQQLATAATTCADWYGSTANGHMRSEMERYDSEIEIPDAVASRVKSLARPVHVLALIEDWCGDVRRHAPVLAKICALNPDKLRLRCVDKET